MNQYESTRDLIALQEIAELVMGAISAQTLEQVLQRIANAARGLVGAELGALGIPDGKGGLRHFMISGLSDEEVAKIGDLPTGKGLLGVIMNERITVIQNDIASDPRSTKLPPGHPPLYSLLGVPIQAAGELFGMLYLSNKANGELFDLHDQWLVETLAGYAALAIAGSELHENQQRLTLLEERQRIAMELHDGIIQSLYAIGMNLDLIRKGSVPIETIDQSIDGLNMVIDDIRAYIMDLQTRNQATLNRSLTVRSTLAGIISRFYVPNDTTVSINAPDEPVNLPHSVFESVCMIAREAFSNALRHAEASYVSVYCDQQDGRFELLVRDNGKGFDLARNKRDRGLGLQNIRERVRYLSGDLKIESQPGYGTSIRVSIPLATIDH